MVERAEGIGTVNVAGTAFSAVPSVTALPVPPILLVVGFTRRELVELHATYCNGARGAVLIGVRRGMRILTIAVPPARSAEGAYRQMREAARRLRAAHSDGWLMARRASAHLRHASEGMGYSSATKPEEFLLVQEYVKPSAGEPYQRGAVSLLHKGETPTFYTYASEAGTADRLVAILIEACG